MNVLNMPYATLIYDATAKRLTQRWQGFAKSEEFRAVIDKTVHFVSSNDVRQIMSVTLEQEVVKPADSEYAAKAMPKLFAKGLQNMAFVMPQNVLTKMSLKTFEQASQGNTQVNYFSSESEATDWLNSLS